ncbi:hypothetical protein [Chitinophaga parva]|uniref:hypothetical protein n=1 Tax=Chitinophaga parva TaxID=2169414 RepID=UPI00105747F8|nr:hypothetical protein [Chitinophaga parva]
MLSIVYNKSERLKFNILRIPLFVTILYLFCISCQSTKEYQASEIKRIQSLYRIKFIPDANTPSRTRKEIKIGLEELERAAALAPDSIEISQYSGQDAGQAVIDSFYKNHYKILYIQQHNFQSKHKILLQPSSN